MSNSNDPLMKIKNIKKLAKFLAINTAQECGIDLKKDKIKNYINCSNITQIIREHAKKNKNGDLLINNKILYKIQEDITSWIIGVILAKSAANDEIDCLWDDNKNCMVFKFK